MYQVYSGPPLCILNLRLDYIALYIFGPIVSSVSSVFARFVLGAVFLKCMYKHVHVIHVKEHNVVSLLWIVMETVQ